MTSTFFKIVVIPGDLLGLFTTMILGELLVRLRGLLIPTTLPPTVATTPPWVFIEGARVVSPEEFVLEILGRLTEIVVFIGVAVCLLFVFVVTVWW